MNTTFKVLISSGGQNQNYQQRLLETLHAMEGVAALVCESHPPASPTVRGGMSETLDGADCFIAVLTSESLDSPSVLREIIQAQDWGGEMIYLVEASAEAKLPFIRNGDLLLFDGPRRFNDTLKEVKNKIGRLQKSGHPYSRAGELLRKLRESLSEFRYMKQGFLVEVLNRLLGRLLIEAEGLKTPYRENLSIAESLLVRAEPLFSHAEAVYAVSKDSGSSFWTNEQQRPHTRRYITKQPPGTIRLFVFSSARRAHHHLHILEANNRVYGSAKYGGRGAVLVCSLESYQSWLAKLGFDAEGLCESQGEDFAVLKFGEFTVRATLDNSEFKFEEVDPQGSHAGSYAAYASALQRFLELEEGAIDPGSNFLRWSSELVADLKLWAKTLSRLFAEGSKERGGEVYHLVFYSDEVREETVINAKRRLLEEKEALGLKTVWYGSNFPSYTHDRKLGGAIKIEESGGMRFLLLMRFDSKEDLSRFYSHPVHSDIRREVFTDFDPRIAELYKQMEELKSEGEDTKELYERMEAEASRFIRRHDYIDSESPDPFTRLPPFPFDYD